VPCVCVFLSWLGCHYCGRDWEQRERLPPSAGTTCSDEWHSVWLLLSWDGNEYVQVCIVMIPSYQEQLHIGNEYVQVRIIMIPSYHEQSHIGNGQVQLCVIMITSYHEQSHIGNEHVQICIIMVTSYQEQSHIGNEYVQVRIIMIPSYQELSHCCNALRLVFMLYLVYLLSCSPTSLTQIFFFSLFPLSLQFMWEQFKYALYNFSEIPTYSVLTVIFLYPLTPYNVCS